VVEQRGGLRPRSVLGLTTIVATWQPTSLVLTAQSVAVPPSPSSEVMTRSGFPV
jgi:hypothetical protein